MSSCSEFKNSWANWLSFDLMDSYDDLLNNVSQTIKTIQYREKVATAIDSCEESDTERRQELMNRLGSFDLHFKKDWKEWWERIG